MTDADVCVVGGGVAGLTVAAFTARAGLRTVVLERDDAVGGMLAPAHLGGLDADAGAESFATRVPALPDLVADLDLGLELASPDPVGAWLVFGAADGIRRAPLPRRSVLGVPADLDAPDLTRITGPVRERLVAVPAEGDEPSVHTLVRERLGDAVADLLVDTICRSVYSRGARDLRLSAIHPGLWRALHAEGSLVAAAAQVASGPQAGGAVGGLRGGMWRLPRALAAAAVRSGAAVHTHVEAQSVADDGDAAVVRTARGELRARRVVLAAGPRAHAAWRGRPAPASVPVATALILLRGTGLGARPVGTGAVVAAGVPTRAKALTHADAKWAWLREQLAADRHLVRVSAGDDGRWLGDASALAAEITTLTGVSVAPHEVEAVDVRRWDAASAVIADPDGDTSAVRETGTAVAGTGLAAVIPHARRTADALIRSHLPVRP